MQSVFGLVPHAWQEEAISHIIALTKDDLHLPFRLVTTAMMAAQQSTDLSFPLPDTPIKYLQDWSYKQLDDESNGDISIWKKVHSSRYFKNHQVRCLRMDAQDVMGACYVCALCQSFHRGEPYVMQVD
jgi:hypothetical protein